MPPPGVPAAWLPALLAATLAAPPVQFLHITDTHVVDLERVAAPIALARGHLREAGPRLAALFEVFSDPNAGAYRPDFYLLTGDLVDAFRFPGEGGRPAVEQIEAWRAAAGRSSVPVFAVLGNHDVIEVRGAAEAASVAGARAAWRRAEPCFRRGAWYAFERSSGAATFRFLMLDNSETVAREQLDWLRREIRSAGSRVLIVALHAPPGEAVAAALAGGRVALVLCGHTHGNGVVTLAGGAVAVRTAAFAAPDSNWRRVRLLEDRIEIYATGRPDALEKSIRIR